MTGPAYCLDCVNPCLVYVHERSTCSVGGRRFRPVQLALAHREAGDGMIWHGSWGIVGPPRPPSLRVRADPDHLVYTGASGS